MDYVIYVATLAAYFTGVAVLLRIVVGDCGVVSLAHAAFLGIGAYIPTVLLTSLGVPPGVGILAALVAGLVLGYGLSVISTRIHGDYLVILTLAFQIVVTSILENGGDITGGPSGLSVQPLVAIGSPLLQLALAVGLAVVAILLSLRIRRSFYGWSLIAVRDDEYFAQSIGKNTMSLKASAFALSAGLVAMIGSFYGGFVGFIDPDQFAVGQSVLILSMVILGGPSRISGAVLGAISLVVLPELLRAFGLPGAQVGNVRQIVFGLLLTLLVCARPMGFARADGVGPRY